MKSSKVEVGFGEWLELACKYGDLLMPLVMMGVLMFGTIMLPIVGFYISVGLGIAFGLTLRYAWKQDCKNPPWYLTERAREIDRNAKASDH